jgi:hypothetical protein
MKIIAFGNSRYKRIALNWARHLEALKISNYTIYSTDRDIYNFLMVHKINTELIPFDPSKNNSSSVKTHHLIWDLRFKFMSDLLNQGYDVLHSDLDAVWLRNPINFISGEYDIISSSGNMPKVMYDVLGLTFCMGWIYIKSNGKTLNIFKNILSKNSHQFDEQVSFNRYLIKQGIPHVSDYQKNIKKIIFGDITTLVLSQEIISRHISHDQNTFVSHPLSRSHGTDRELFLKQQNLWILDND